MATGRTTIVALVAILLAAVAVAVVVLGLPAGRAPDSAPSTTAPQRIDTNVLQRSDYTGLDSSLLQQGALPVQPPPNIGKANPFL